MSSHKPKALQRTVFYPTVWGVLLLAVWLGLNAGGLVLPLAEGAEVPRQLYSHGNPTPAEQLMVELINRARSNPSAEATRLGIALNEGIDSAPISADPKQPLTFNPQLLEAARGHSRWMLDHDMFAHVQTGGIGPGDRMRTANYVFSGSWTWGENIAFRATTGGPLPLGPTVTLEHNDLFIDTDIEGRGHRVNLMNNSFREAGLGVELGIYTSQGSDFNAVMATQDFAATGANPGPFILGVVYRDTDGDGFYSPGEGLPDITVVPGTGEFYATTSASGGYAIPLTGVKGVVEVTFSGGPLNLPVTRSIRMDQENVKVDLETIRDSVATFGFVANTPRRSPDGLFEVDLFGPANTLVSIEVSANLLEWNKIGDLNLTGAIMHFSEAPPAAATYRFYRAVKR